ncbi:hypothetical protein CcCBS67573_g00329 [Chytriomyces confervae]|uniref:Tyrosine specific protein phosphatases domain-containing protein n=1 Tax=Chytriomyces confervae TaxID=246404 RepID=A0A507FPS1_9FUNG|nr:hypothetical protein HDU80_007152 [Chytriomyces hyalinus]TPX78419.1 hypothetical protein CcCBS67573_g00329 [Chytriomyces confervae]
MPRKYVQARGVFSLVDTSMDEYPVPAWVDPHHVAQCEKRDKGLGRHCTVIGPTDSIMGAPEARRTLLLDRLPAPDEVHVVLAGTGRAQTSVFVVVCAAELLEARAVLGLGWTDLHVTLAFDQADLHPPKVYKGPGSLVVPSPGYTLELGLIDQLISSLKDHWRRLFRFEAIRPNLFRFCTELSTYVIDNTNCVTRKAKLLNFRSMVHFHSLKYLESYADAIESLNLDQSTESIARLADAAWKCHDYSACLRACWKLYLTSPQAPKVKAHAWDLLKKLWHLSVVNLEVVAEAAAHPNLNLLLLTPAELTAYHELRFNLIETDAAVVENHTLAKTKVVMNTSHKLPRRFSWVIPLLLAGMSTPKSEEDIIALKALGITTVFTLTEEEPLPKAWFETHEMTNFFWPVTNYYPPAIAHADRFNQILLQHMLEKKGGILVHCGGGIGRAGSLLCTYLVRYGLNAPPPLCSRCETRMPIHCDDTECALGKAPSLSAKDAIDLLRSIRPQSIETQHQEHFISDFASELFRRAGSQMRIYSPLEPENEPVPGELKCARQRTPSPLVIVLCGLPGSGKSWFSEMLLKSASSKWVAVSQDDLGSKDACETAVSTYGKHLGNPHCILIDKCNPTLAERTNWLKLMGMPRSAVLVHFNTPKEVCIQRASYRLDHPTVRPKSAKTIVTSFANQFEAPVDATEHKGYQAIYTVSSFSDSVALLSHFGIKVSSESSIQTGFVKYPRTRHLFDLGAASRDDLILDETARFLNTNMGGDTLLTIEEKIDGANLGFRLNPSDPSQIIAQNRTHTVTSASHAQFASLNAWIYMHQDALLELCGRGCILFGEWMFARHSVIYNALPDLFVAFDLFDLREGKFYSRARFDAALADTGISRVPRIPLSLSGITRDDLLGLIQEKSAFSTTERREGLVLRLDKGDWLDGKAKIVRPDFICGNEHWSKNIIERNLVQTE